MKRNSIKLLPVTLLTIALGIPSVSLAFGLPKLPGAEKTEAPSGGATADASQSGDALVVKYMASKLILTEAQILLSEAFGLKEEKAALEAEKTAFSAGATADTEAFKKNQTTSAAADAKINEKIAAGEALSEDGKKAFISSLPLLLKGLQLTAQLPNDFQAFTASAQQQITSAPMMEKLKVKDKLAAGFFVVSDVPSYLSTLTSTLGKVTTYATSQGIEMPKNAEESL